MAVEGETGSSEAQAAEAEAGPMRVFAVKIQSGTHAAVAVRAKPLLLLVTSLEQIVCTP